MTNVFISYRHGDTLAAAAHLHEELPRHLPDVRIFRDVASLLPADEWMHEIVQTMRSADWCLVLIGRNWLEARLEGPAAPRHRADVVRLEISTAITLGIPVLPVTVEGAEMPPTAILPLSVARPSGSSARRCRRRIRRRRGPHRLGAARATQERAPHTDPAGADRASGRGRRRPAAARTSSVPTARTSSPECSCSRGRPGRTPSRSSRRGSPTSNRVCCTRNRCARARRRDAGRPETDYTESPRELVGKTLFWRLRPASPALLLLRPPGEAETARAGVAGRNGRAARPSR